MQGVARIRVSEPVGGKNLGLSQPTVSHRSYSGDTRVGEGRGGRAAGLDFMSGQSRNTVIPDAPCRTIKPAPSSCFDFDGNHHIGAFKRADCCCYC